MMCLYCNRITCKDHSAASKELFDCTKCGVTFFMLRDGTPDIISYEFPNHQIDLDFEYPTCTRLFKKSGKDNIDYELLLKLPHIIPIDPTRKDYWLHKLLNLLVFQ